MNAVSPQSETDSGLAYLPVFFGMRGRMALLIGGAAALPKLTLLRRAGARVRLVAQQMDDSMADAIAGDRMVVCTRTPLAAHHFNDAVMAIDASGDEATNRLSVSLARPSAYRSTSWTGPPCATSSCLRSSTARRWWSRSRPADLLPPLPASSGSGWRRRSQRASAGSPRWRRAFGAKCATVSIRLDSVLASGKTCSMGRQRSLPWRGIWTVPLPLRMP